MKEQAEKALKEMLDISTDIHRAILFSGDQVLASNFPESLHQTMIGKAGELAALGAARASEMGSSPLTQLVVESGGGSVFLVREAKEGGMAVLATGEKDSRIGLVFYDMKTCMRDTQEEPDAGYAADVPATPDVETAASAATGASDEGEVVGS